MSEALSRCELLVGPEAMQRLAALRVAVFGIGGVGGWCAEALVRSGVGHLTLVDPDVVSPSNINRQVMAATSTLGMPKVEALRARLLDIRPEADIRAVQAAFTAETAADFHLESFDYIVDAIDSLKDKAALLLKASESPATLFSSMGAACKLDPTKVRVAEFLDVRGCPLGAALRKKMRRAKTLPAKPFLCVYDDEVLPNLGETDETCSYKAQMNGTMAPVTAIFGFTLSGLIIQDVCTKGTTPAADGSPIPPQTPPEQELPE